MKADHVRSRLYGLWRLGLCRNGLPVSVQWIDRGIAHRGQTDVNIGRVVHAVLARDGKNGQSEDDLEPGRRNPELALPLITGGYFRYFFQPRT